MVSTALIEKVVRAGVIAVVTIDDAHDAPAVARALSAGGVWAVELTFRTPAAPEALRCMRDSVPDMLIGAGTILNREQLAVAAAAGAQFAVAPGCNPSTLRAARDLQVPFAPGVCSPSEIEVAVEHGCRLLKYFPAETSGGLTHLATMAAPFQHLGLRFVPLGGIGFAQLGDYLASPLVAAVGGSWLAKSDAIRRRDWAGIEQCATEARRVVDRTRCC